MTSFAAGVRNNEVKLSIRPVLDQGLIVYADILPDGTRVVTFENPQTSFRQGVLPETVRCDFFGQGSSIDVALFDALCKFHGIKNSGRLAKIYSARSSRITIMLSDLDAWLLEHDGRLRALSDFDGEIFLRLEGCIDIVKSRYQPIALESYGKSFFHALDATLTKAKTNLTQTISTYSTSSTKMLAEVGVTTDAGSQVSSLAEITHTTFDNVHHIIKFEKRVRLS